MNERLSRSALGFIVVEIVVEMVVLIAIISPSGSGRM